MSYTVHGERERRKVTTGMIRQATPDEGLRPGTKGWDEYRDFEIKRVGLITGTSSDNGEWFQRMSRGPAETLLVLNGKCFPPTFLKKVPKYNVNITVSYCHHSILRSVLTMDSYNENALSISVVCKVRRDVIFRPTSHEGDV